jgi:molybdopterin converting factor small subunit
VRVFVPQPLLSYTGGAKEVEAEGASLDALLADLDRQFPGIRFRIVDERDRMRRHVKFFVNRAQVGSLDTPLEEGDEVHIFQALSGG